MKERVGLESSCREPGGVETWQKNQSEGHSGAAGGKPEQASKPRFLRGHYANQGGTAGQARPCQGNELNLIWEELNWR